MKMTWHGLNTQSAVTLHEKKMSVVEALEYRMLILFGAVENNIGVVFFFIGHI